MASMKSLIGFKKENITATWTGYKQIYSKSRASEMPGSLHEYQIWASDTDYKVLLKHKKHETVYYDRVEKHEISNLYKEFQKIGRQDMTHFLGEILTIIEKLEEKHSLGQEIKSSASSCVRKL